MLKHWKKGCIHCHTLWSDGLALPEMAIMKYQELGYDFLCLADHNLFQDQDDVWMPVHSKNGDWPPDLYYDEYDRAMAAIPDAIETRRLGFRTFVHLSTFAQLKERYHRPGRFLLFPGEELTDVAVSFEEETRKYDLHVNVFNIAKDLPCPDKGTDKDILHAIIDNYNEVANEGSFLMVNHPWSRVWDVDPRLLIDTPEIRHFEICNNGSNDMPEEWIYNREQYWDFVLAHRLAKGNGIIYGVASDDAHYYDDAYRGKHTCCGSGWLMVDCMGELTEQNIASSLKNGNFYSSNGVYINDIEFNARTGTLEVNVQAEPGLKYRIDFITTKKNFDRHMELKEFTLDNAIRCRTRPVIPEGIGRIASSVDGTSASYAMESDDLYVRALITSNRPGMLKAPHYPRFESAWTQPYPNCR